MYGAFYILVNSDESQKLFISDSRSCSNDVAEVPFGVGDWLRPVLQLGLGLGATQHHGAVSGCCHQVVPDFYDYPILPVIHLPAIAASRTSEIGSATAPARTMARLTSKLVIANFPHRWSKSENPLSPILLAVAAICDDDREGRPLFKRKR